MKSKELLKLLLIKGILWIWSEVRERGSKTKLMLEIKIHFIGRDK